MKRDMELIRLLLQEVEGEEPKPDLSAYPQAALLYHLDLMEEAGLIMATVIRQSGKAIAVDVSRLTNTGHDFLYASRSDTVWKKFKAKLTEVGGSVAMSIATDLLKKYSKEELGL